MKPTPSKLVLLMSAAGLGLSWSGLALASRDNGAAPNAALAFGISPRGEPGCGSQPVDAWATCPAVDGELLRTIVADAAASSPHPTEARVSDDEPRPKDKAPHPDVLATAPAVDDPCRVGEADALAWVLLDDPPGAADDTAALDGCAAAHAPPSVVKTDAAAHQKQAEVRSGAAAPAAAAVVVTPAEWASVDQVLASLAEVLGAHIEESAKVVEAPYEHGVAHEPQITPRQSAAAAMADAPRRVAASPIEAARNDGEALASAVDAGDIVMVSSHSEKVLMSLAALRSGEASDSGRLGAQTKKAVVVRHTDKVLETLALFQSKKPKQTAFACTSAPDGWAADSALAGLGAEPDILLDLLPTVVDRPEKPALQALSTPTTPPPVRPAAGARDRSALGADLVALNADKLNEVRGGFVTDGGLRISFGIERAVYLNGNLVTTTSLNIADLARISGGGVALTSNDASKLALLQSGAGNTFAPGTISSTAAGTFIQNTLDNQKINTITRIDAVVNSAGIMRAINLQSSMQGAIVNSLRR